ncbi:hypothetical protein ACF0H5_012308 [Mactra antiquata]
MGGGIAGSVIGNKGQKRKDMKSIEEKYAAIIEVEKGDMSKARIVKKYDVPPSTLSTWIKRKDEIIEAYQKFGPKLDDESIIEECMSSKTQTAEDGDDDDNDDDSSLVPRVPTTEELLKSVSLLKTYLRTQENTSEYLNCLDKMSDKIVKDDLMKKCSTQRSRHSLNSYDNYCVTTTI